MIVTAKQNGAMSFEINQGGFIFDIDANKEVGGEGKGPSPKGLLLSGLIGCTGMDVASILKKMRVEYTDLDVTAETTYTEEHPKVFKDILVKFLFKGEEEKLDLKKIKRAVTLSQEKYCGVTEMLRKNSKILSEIYINNNMIEFELIK